jgi:hypothetical protein
MSKFEQREKVKFYVKLGKSSNKTFQIIKQAYGEDALGRRAIFKWHKCFAQWRDILVDDNHNGRPRTIRIERKIQEVATFVCVNHFQTVDEFAEAAQQ